VLRQAVMRRRSRRCFPSAKLCCVAASRRRRRWTSFALLASSAVNAAGVRAMQRSQHVALVRWWVMLYSLPASRLVWRRGRLSVVMSAYCRLRARTHGSRSCDARCDDDAAALMFSLYSTDKSPIYFAALPFSVRCISLSSVGFGRRIIRNRSDQRTLRSHNYGLTIVRR
jgi:hypothetical protein